MDSEDLPTHDGLNVDPYAKSKRLTTRLLALPFFCAFWSFDIQIDGLIGSSGILPASSLMKRAHEVVSFLELPTLAWLSSSDEALHAMTWMGMLACLFLLIDRFARTALLFVAICYLSLINCSGPFMGYQWDVLVVESAIAAMFLRTRVALPKPLNNRLDLGWMLFAFLIFKLMFSSGVVKLSSGDSTWRDLSALRYHYWTQPLPNGLSWYVHQLPNPVHQLSCLMVLVIELVGPCLVIFHGWPRRLAALSFMLLQLVIGLTGNYGFFNLLSAILCASLLDDAFLARIGLRLRNSRNVELPFSTNFFQNTASKAITSILCVSLLCFSLMDLGETLLGSSKLSSAIKSPFASLRMTNRYGLFAVMTRKREEIIFEGLFGTSSGDVWKPYTFHYKPGNPSEAPTSALFHMPRLDWGLWFAALGSPSHERYVPIVANKLRQKDEALLSLLPTIPSPTLPLDVRIMYYSYKFSEESNCWVRTATY